MTADLPKAASSWRTRRSASKASPAISIGGRLRQLRIGPGQVLRLPRGEQKFQRITERVDEGIDVCAQPTPAVADRLILVFLLGASALCRAREQWCCRSSHIRCRCRLPSVATGAPTPRPFLSG